MIGLSNLMINKKVPQTFKDDYYKQVQDLELSKNCLNYYRETKNKIFNPGYHSNHEKTSRHMGINDDDFLSKLSKKTQNEFGFDQKIRNSSLKDDLKNKNHKSFINRNSIFIQSKQFNGNEQKLSNINLTNKTTQIDQKFQLLQKYYNQLVQQNDQENKDVNKFQQNIENCNKLNMDRKKKIYQNNHLFLEQQSNNMKTHGKSKSTRFQDLNIDEMLEQYKLNEVKQKTERNLEFKEFFNRKSNENDQISSLQNSMIDIQTEKNDISITTSQIIIQNLNQYDNQKKQKQIELYKQQQEQYQQNNKQIEQIQNLNLFKTKFQKNQQNHQNKKIQNFLLIIQNFMDKKNKQVFIQNLYINKYRQIIYHKLNKFGKLLQKKLIYKSFKLIAQKQKQQNHYKSISLKSVQLLSNLQYERVSQNLDNNFKYQKNNDSIKSFIHQTKSNYIK